MSNITTITAEQADKIQTIAGVEIKIGDVYTWNGDDLSTVTVTAIDLNEERDGIAGSAIAPYAWVQWSDDEKPSTMNLATIGAYLRRGSFTKDAA